MSYGWVPIKASSFAATFTNVFAAGVSWDGSTLVANGLNLGSVFGVEVAKLIFNHAGTSGNEGPARLRVTVESYSAASPGAGTGYLRSSLITTGSGDSTILAQSNEAAPWPDGVWGASDVTAFTPSPVEFDCSSIDVHFDYLPTLCGSGGSAPMAVESWRLRIDVWAVVETPPGDCFWTDLLLTSEDCTP